MSAARWGFPAAVVVALVLAVPGALAKGQAVTVDAGTRVDGSMYFTPAVLRFHKGDLVTLTVNNRDTNTDGSVRTPHDLAIFGFGEAEKEGEEAAACPQAQEHEGRKVPFEVCKEATITRTFQVGQPGVYAFVCEVPGHAELGMTGTVIIEGDNALLGVGSGVNWLAVLVTAFVPMAVGFGWYGALGKRWMAAQGLTEADKPRMKREAPKAYAASFVTALLTSFVLWHVVRWSGAWAWWQGFAVGFVVWLGFVATVLVGMTLFERRSWTLFWISSMYNLVTLLVMGPIFVVWT